jgi:RNA polymerase sigma-70 factor (ECF subfamily)
MVAVLKKPAAPGQAEFHKAIAARGDRWYSACLSITRNPEMAEDAVQEALLSAWNGRHRFQHASRLETWIHRIAVNAALQQLRRNRPGVFEPLPSDVGDDSWLPEDMQSDRQLESDLAAAILHLTEIERVCFVLKHLEEWRLAEIADELAINVGMVKQAIFRAVRKLRGRMSRLQEESS